jgi:ribosomal protein L32E
VEFPEAGPTNAQAFASFFRTREVSPSGIDSVGILAAGGGENVKRQLLATRMARESLPRGRVRIRQRARRQ